MTRIESIQKGHNKKGLSGDSSKGISFGNSRGGGKEEHGTASKPKKGKDYIFHRRFVAMPIHHCRGSRGGRQISSVEEISGGEVR